jgi:hypothetical protein
MNAWNYRPGVAALQREDPINRPKGPGTDPVPEPGTPPPPITSVTTDWAQRSSNRARMTRDFLQANPSRRPGPMGRNAGGQINYDPSSPYYHYFLRHGPQGGPNRMGAAQKPAEPTSPGALTDPKRGAFNAAFPR